MPRGPVRPTYIDLFSGCGGASVGFHDAGFECLLAVDWDQQAVDTYNANFPRHRQRLPAVRADLSRLTSHADVSRFLESYGVVKGSCDVIVGGPPCQSFSSVGRTKVAALSRKDARVREEWIETARNRTMLFEVYALFVEVLAPRWFLFENVPTIRSHETYPLIEQRFEGLSRWNRTPLPYTLSRENYWASDYGVPQRRRRFIMVGYRNDAGIPSWKRPAKIPGPAVQDAIGDLPTVDAGHRVPVIAYAQQPQSEYQQLMREGLNGADANTVIGHICRSHNLDDIELFRRMAPGARFSDPEVQVAIEAINPDHKLKKYSKEKFQDKLHKLDPEREAWTITAHLQKDCYKFIHYRDARTITVREAARLQSFPDRFKLPEVMGVGFRVVGNAIPPLLAQAFAESFRCSDPDLGSINDRVRALVPDAVWELLEPRVLEEFPARTAGNKPVPPRVVFAAGVLRWHREWSQRDVGEYLGYHSETLNRKFRQAFSSGLWHEAERLLADAHIVALQGELELMDDEGPHDIAAD